MGDELSNKVFVQVELRVSRTNDDLVDKHAWLILLQHMQIFALDKHKHMVFIKIKMPITKTKS